jgi:AraC-like DNA-binding protein
MPHRRSATPTHLWPHAIDDPALGPQGIVLVGLPPRDTERVRAALPGVNVVSLDQPLSRAVLCACLCGVVDPAFLADAHPTLRWAELLGNLQLSCIFLTDASPAAFRSALSASHVTPYRLLLRGVDDDSPALAAAIAQAPPFAHAQQLLTALGSRVAGLSGPLRAACERLIFRPERFFDASDLARAALLSRRHLDRTLREHGLGTAKPLVIGARVWQAHRLIGVEGHSIRRAAALLGYSDGKSLARHVRAVLRDEAGCVREACAGERVLHAIVRFIGAIALSP